MSRNLIVVILVSILGLVACTGADCEMEDISLALPGYGGHSHHSGGYYSTPVYYYEPAPVVVYDYGYYDECYYDCWW